jgi:hypothetical protein
MAEGCVGAWVGFDPELVILDDWVEPVAGVVFAIVYQRQGLYENVI